MKNFENDRLNNTANDKKEIYDPPQILDLGSIKDKFEDSFGVNT